MNTPKTLLTALFVLASAGCAEAVPSCGLCQGLGGAWLPESDVCADTCEEQAEGVLCVEGVCPADAPADPAAATTCEQCILAGGAWAGEPGACEGACGEGDDACYTTRCPDGSG